MKEWSKATIDGKRCLRLQREQAAESLGANRRHFTRSSNASTVQYTINAPYSDQKNHHIFMEAHTPKGFSMLCP
jgi:hypothetical protein